MHHFFLPLGVGPNNAIVGAQGSMALGAAMFKHNNKQPGISTAIVGDAGVAVGPI